VQTELAKWPRFYPDLEVQVFAPRFYHKAMERNGNDNYSRNIVKGKHEDLSDFFFVRVKRVFPKLPFKPDLIVVVPCSKLGEFSPTMLALGRKLSNKLCVPNDNIIQLVREGKKHTDCTSSDERYEATEGTIKVTRTLKGERVVLLDDTKVTGMIFLECAKELKTMGASDVIGVCLGINRSKKKMGEKGVKRISVGTMAKTR
jgi:phosphoribosylpyrophosphate synthetase